MTLHSVILAAALMSVAKPIILLIVVGLWAWVVSRLDKDIKKHYLKQDLWNPVQLAAGAVAVLLWLLIPIFFLGMFVALLVMGGGIVAYAMHRNGQVSAHERWDFSLDSFKRKLNEREVAAAQTQAAVRLLHPDGSAMEVPAGADPMAEPHQTLENALGFLLTRGGERLELHVNTERARLSAVVDGVKYDLPGLESRVGLGIVEYLKSRSGMDPADRRRRQSGSQLIDAGAQGRHTLGLTTFGSTKGVVLHASIDAARRTVRKLDELGMLPVQLQALNPIFDEKKRVVLVSCGPQNGQTTTLYSLLARHDPYTHSIMTLEESHSIDLEGVTHDPIEPGADGATWSKRVAALIRKGPDVVLVEKVIDPQVARVIADAHDSLRTYVGLAQPDTFSALKVWAKAVGDLKQVAASLQAIVAVRLLRRLCTTCRVPYHPDAEALRKMNLSPDKVTQLYKHSGQVLVRGKPQTCLNCMGIGYKGRIGVFEVMILDDAGRELLVQGHTDPLRAHLRKQKMLYLQEAALARVVEGVTSIGEVTRALAVK